MSRQQILLTNLREGPKVEESQMIGMKSKLFFYRDQNRNSIILQGPKEVLTLLHISLVLNGCMKFRGVYLSLL